MTNTSLTDAASWFPSPLVGEGCDAPARKAGEASREGGEAATPLRERTLACSPTRGERGVC
jgi:hypothetical protein